MRASMRTGRAARRRWPESSATASCSISTYSSNPSAATWPDCSAPSRSPAPRISRSRIAIAKPGTELGVVGERREPRARLGRQLARLGIEEVRVREPVAAADAAADLVELDEAELVGALDDQRVRLRDVEARLDDRRRDEHVRVAGEEREHLVLELALRHLAVRDEEAQVRAELPELLRRLLDRLDAVVQVERLAVALDLALERLLDQLFVVLADVGADRPAALRRRLDHRDVAQAGERHVQRARDRRRAEREHVDLEAQLPQQLLLRDAEALLLVDDDQAELLRDHVAGEDAVRADQDLDLPSLNSASTFFTSDGLRKRETISTRTGKSR